MKVRDWKWARDVAKLRVNADSTQTHQDFTDADWQDIAQESYEEIVLEAKAQRSPDYFLSIYDLTWPEGQVDLDLTTYSIFGSEIWSIRDKTDTEYSEGVDITRNILVRSANVLLWPDPNGPSSDRSIRMVILSEPEELKDDIAPLLIPPQHMHYLAIRMAIMAREIADEQAPNSWYNTAERRKLAFDKYLVARFKSRPPEIRVTSGEKINTLPSVDIDPNSSFGPYSYS